jgi:hypothetical protein
MGEVPHTTGNQAALYFLCICRKGTLGLVGGGPHAHNLAPKLTTSELGVTPVPVGPLFLLPCPQESVAWVMGHGKGGRESRDPQIVPVFPCS